MEFEREESAMDCDGVSMEQDVVEAAMPRRARGRGRLRAQTKTLGRRPNVTPVATAPQRSIEGWIVLITGIHEEAQEDDILGVFGDYGAIKNLHMNLDRRTGFVKGYALIEYENLMEAEGAIKGMNGTKLFGQTIFVDPAFSNGPFGTDFRRLPQVNRSRSPRRKF